jgi:coenzyme F420-reducing hydrogenase gamma subunit
MRAFRITAAALMLSASTGAMAQTADRIWHGGTILTMEDEAMRVEAIAEDDGTIIAVGTCAVAAPPDIAPLLRMLNAGENTHTHADGSECPGDATAVLAHMIASGAAGQ